MVSYIGLVPKSKYNLELVQIVIRHGDRYYINPVPNYNTSNISCIIEQSLIDHVPQLKDYAQVCLVKGSALFYRIRQLHSLVFIVL